MPRPDHPDEGKRKTTQAEKRGPKPPLPQPRWVPPGTKFSSLPAELQRALNEIVSPAYEQLVMAANDALERSTGMSVVYLLWMELAGHLQVGRSYSDDRMVADHLHYEDHVDRILELIEAKAKMTCVLGRLRELQRRSSSAQGAEGLSVARPTDLALPLPPPEMPMKEEPNVAKPQTC
jgi:hypothetical protein